MAKRRNGLGQVTKLGYWRESDARALIDAWRATGETLTRFASRRGVKRERLARWLKRLDGPNAPILHPVRLVSRPGSTIGDCGAIELRLADGSRVVVAPGFSSDDLRRVLSVLAESPSC